MIALKTVLKANAASCIIFGAIFLWIPANVAIFLAQNSPLPDRLLTIIGGALLANGLHLLWAYFKSTLSKLLILYFSIGDFIWVFATISLLILKIGITTDSGIIASILVAGLVGVFGLLQIAQLGERNG